MKKVLLSIICLLSATLCFSQVTIVMEETNGVYKIPCSVNGLKMKFIFDTGASVVSISQSMAEYMFDNDYLTEKDIIGKAQTQIADGSLVNVNLINIKDFEVAGFHLKNVTATVKEGQNVPLLMGQSAIEKLGRVSIEGNKLIIHKPKINLTANEIALLRKEIQASYKAQDWEKVVEKSARLKEATTFNNQWDYYYYIFALRYNGEFKQGVADAQLLLLDEWESSNIKTDNKIRSELYEEKAYLYSVHRWNDEKSLEYLHKALKYCTPYNKYSVLSSLSIAYDGQDRGEYAINYKKQSIEAYLDYKKLSLQMVLDNNVKDDYLGFEYWMLALLEEKYNSDYADRNFYLKLSAKCGYQEAIDFCFQNNINFVK